MIDYKNIIRQVKEELSKLDKHKNYLMAILNSLESNAKLAGGIAIHTTVSQPTLPLGLTSRGNPRIRPAYKARHKVICANLLDCPRNGKAYLASRSDSKYCSKKCADRKRKRDLQEPSGETRISPKKEKDFLFVDPNKAVECRECHNPFEPVPGKFKSVCQDCRVKINSKNAAKRGVTLLKGDNLSH